ncbi:hypothetical protein FRX31_015769 [Thalictrum thalictroides]|uniref:Uncharacterized protein n=1 Tax=Thalictrum thalictroides TaxID=46969 RepID=A0A7J6WCE1_THATH|nr:hypothetical protein FRX31_015769 [Thalictrum thalictroides]
MKYRLKYRWQISSSATLWTPADNNLVIVLPEFTYQMSHCLHESYGMSHRVHLICGQRIIEWKIVVLICICCAEEFCSILLYEDKEEYLHISVRSLSLGNFGNERWMLGLLNGRRSTSMLSDRPTVNKH